MMSRVVWPLSTTLVCGSPADERMPLSAVSPPAACSAAVSLALRGALPNSASSVCACAALADCTRAAPGVGGTSAKSGGMISEG